MRVLRTVILLATVATIGAAGASAESESAEDRGHHVHGDHAMHPNHIAVFVGLTHGGGSEEGEEETSAATIGLEYERRLSRKVGIGVLAEYVDGDRRDHVGMALVSLRPGRRAKLILGAGLERHEGKGEYAFLGRVGFGYAFEPVPGNSVSPEINLDFVDGHTLVVVGATIGWGF